MSAPIGRREFLGKGGGLAAGGLLGLVHVGAQEVKSSTPAAAALGWKVGVQLYTYRRFSFYEALDKIAALGVRHLEPCFFLKLDKKRPKLKTSETLSAEVRGELKAKLKERGMALTNFYAQLGADADQAKRIFEFSREMGAETIVAEPPAEAFDMIEKLCEEYGINLAVHNHPESPKSKYWKPENVLAVCKGRGKRIGGCCDTGHWLRSGLDPIECLKKMEGRILGFHLKDIAEKGNRKSRDMPLGEGVGGYKAVLEELHRQGYRGSTIVEYEHDSPKLQEDVAKCLAFVEKTAQALGKK